MNFNDIINAVKTGFSNFRLSDALDILIIAILFFWLIRFTRRSRAYQLLRGVGFAFLILVVSQLFGLTTLNWLLDSVLLSGIVFIAIIFQPELRRAFEHLGRGSRLFESRRTGEVYAEQVLSAVTNLARRHVGALIVFQKDIALGEILVTGTRMEALISSELIENVFEPNTPLHDGAMIIGTGKILAAACIIPINNDATLPQELGTRHRAALSVSLISDCLSVVVSEETGKISYAREGVFYRNISVPALRKVLVTELESGSPEGARTKIFKPLKKMNSKARK